MIATLFSLILALMLIFIPSTQGETILPDTNLTILFMLAGSLFALVFVLVNGLVLVPLQKAEKNATPHIIDLFKKDRSIFLVNTALVIFTLINFIYAYDPTFLHKNQKFFFGLWILLAGLTLDFIHYYFKRTLSYLNPFSFVQIITQEARKCIFAERDNNLFEWIDALTEIANKAIDKSSISLCIQSVNEMQQIAKHFMDSCKSISHLSPKTKENNGKDAEEVLGRDADEVNFLILYLSQRFEFINERALKDNLEPISSAIVSSLGKLAVHSAKFDLSLVSYPVHFIGRLANRAQEKGLQEISDKATFTLLEISKIIIKEVDYTYADLKEPFLSIISHLDTIAKATFQKDKRINIKVLMQPFSDLKELFKTEKAMAHQDTPVILANLDRILGEFEALDMVLKTMPPLSNEELKPEA